MLASFDTSQVQWTVQLTSAGFNCLDAFLYIYIYDSEGIIKKVECTANSIR